MARPKAADYDEIRDRILQRAVQAFAESGYPGASMASLAARCDTSKATLYHYFESKEAILYESLARYTARLQEVVLASAGPPDSPIGDPPEARRRIAATVRALLVEYRDSRAYHVSLLNDIKYLGAAQRERIRIQERAVVDALARLIAAAAPGRFAPDATRPATMAVLGMINFTFAWLRRDGPMSYERYAELVTDLALNGLAGGAAPALPATSSGLPNRPANMNRHESDRAAE
ncbi:MAG: TetR/AcrR family transcriptional regulator [Lautropia sp.]